MQEVSGKVEPDIFQPKQQRKLVERVKDIYRTWLGVNDPDPGPPRHRHVSRCLNMSRVEENVDNTDQWQQYETLESICDVNVQ